MKLSLIVNALKARASSLEGRVAGSARYLDKLTPELVNMPPSSAYVMPLTDDAEPPMSANDTRQGMHEVFAVVVCLDNSADERGQTAVSDAVDAMRADLWGALLGWRPEDIYNGIYYEGGTLLHLDRSRLLYQYEFGAYREICPEDGWQGPALEAADNFTDLRLQEDQIDPAALPWPGPDGRIEHEIRLTLPTE